MRKYLFFMSILFGCHSKPYHPELNENDSVVTFHSDGNHGNDSSNFKAYSTPVELLDSLCFKPDTVFIHDTIYKTKIVYRDNTSVKSINQSGGITTSGDIINK